MTDYVHGGMSYLGVDDAKMTFSTILLALRGYRQCDDAHYQQLFAQARSIVDGLMNSQANGLFIKDL